MGMCEFVALFSQRCIVVYARNTLMGCYDNTYTSTIIGLICEYLTLPCNKRAPSLHGKPPLPVYD